VHNTARSIIVRWRVLSGDARHRCLPDYLIIGAQKAGTTSLQKALANHPDICASLVKEVHYFDVHYDRGEAWYRAHFARESDAARARLQGRPFATGEATPFYLAHPQAAQRAARTIPEARLIVLLRDPIERAYSQYAHEVRQGREHASVRDALSRELRRGSVGPSAPPVGMSAWDLRYRSYLYRGLYARQLATWMSWFPPDQFLILRSESYFAQPLQTLDQVCTFLGVRKVSALAQPEAFIMHENRGERRDALPADLRQQLQSYFAEPNRALEELLGQEMGW